MKIYTMGFTKKSAEEFFEILKNNNIEEIFDIRRNNKSQLAGFTKKEDLEYFLKEISQIKYKHLIEFAPEKNLISDYRKNKINWDEFQDKYEKILEQYDSWDKIDVKKFENGCFLCSEQKADKCHRRLLVEFIQRKYQNQKIQIVHL